MKMKSVQIDLRPVADVPINERGSRPVSVILSANGESRVISRFGDNVWDFFPYIPQENLKNANKGINWNIRLNEVSTLTSPEYNQLLDSSKEFIWSLFSNPIEGRKRPSMATLIAKFELLTPLLRWMASMHINEFKRLNG